MDDAPTSTITIGSNEEQDLIQQLTALFPEAVAENSRLVVSLAECCLRNRGYDFESAKKRLTKYLSWRKDQFGDLSDQTVEGNEVLQSQMKTGMMYLCPDRMPDGAGLLFVRMRHHDPSLYDSHTTLKYWHYIVMTAMVHDPTLAAAGFVIVNNFEGATMANTDINIPRVISAAINKCVPIRVKSINMVNPPFILRMVIPVFKSVVSAKMASRFNVILTHDELPAFLSVNREILPTELGGDVDVDAPGGYLQKLIDQKWVV